MKLLVVENDELTIQLIRLVCDRLGIELHLYLDFTAALAHIQQSKPDIVIFPQSLKGEDGIAFCKLLKNEEETAYCYLITICHSNNIEDCRSAIESGTDDFVTLPLDLNTLNLRLFTAMNKLNRESIDGETSTQKQEKEIAGQIQGMLLLDLPPNTLSDFQIAAHTIPSSEIGGDFYDFYKHNDDCFDVAFGDVMGKGVPAALIGAATKSKILRSFLWLATNEDSLPTPERIVRNVNVEMTHELMSLDTFVTFCYARFNSRTKILELVDCGHTRTIHYRFKSNSCHLLQGDNVPLGFSDQEEYKQIIVPFDDGDVFLFYSDGVTETRNTENDFFGEERLTELVKSNQSCIPEEIIGRIQMVVDEFCVADTFYDDLTYVAIKFSGIEIESVLYQATLTVTNDLGKLADIRGFVREFCEKCEVFDTDTVDMLELAINEAASNIMVHAYTPQMTGELQLEAVLFDDKLELKLFDSGIPFNPGNVQLPEFDGSKDSGFGIFIMNQVADDVIYSRGEDGRNCVTLVKLRK